MTPRQLLTIVLATAGLLAVAPSAAVAAADSPGASADGGRLVLDWGKFKKGHRPLVKALRKSRRMRAVVNEVNRRFQLPEELSVVFSDQLAVGPAYFPLQLADGTRTEIIHFPGSFLRLQAKILRRQLRGVRRVKPKRLMIFASEFVLAHEIGHLLVDKLDIPVTGREEDAVDGFAAYLLADERRFGARSAIAAAMVFDGLSAPGRRLKADDYADEHSLSEQRVYQFMCWVYGSDRKRFRGLVGRDRLPRKRAVRCADEWRQLNRSWSRLLAPHARG